MKIAYLINQYPKVSHSFIRREIAAIEARGLTVLRYSIRSRAAELVDPADQAELTQTRIVLDGGWHGVAWRLLRAVIRLMLLRPREGWHGLRFAVQVGRGSDRGVIVHLAYWAEACLLLQWFNDAEIDHVHAHFGTNSTTVAMLCHRMGGPSYSFTVHGPEEFDHPVELRLREKIQHAAFVVAISSFGRSQLFRQCEYDQWPKIEVIRCGLEQDFFPENPDPVPDCPKLVCVGRLSEQKGQLLLIQAARLLADQDIHVQFVLVGDGELRPQLEALIETYNLRESIQITGWATGAEVKEQLLAARALILPSFAEGLPVVIMEALALSRPVVSTYVAGIPELVIPGTCGWLVPAGSVEHLTVAIQDVLQTPVDRLNQMGQQGRARVATFHTLEHEAGRLADRFQFGVNSETEDHCGSPLDPTSLIPQDPPIPAVSDRSH